MKEDQNQLSTDTGNDDKEILSSVNVNPARHSNMPWIKLHKWWFEVALYTLFVLSGQTIGNLLGRLYFDKGGNSTWMSTLVQVAGFPVLIPFLLIPSSNNDSVEATGIRKPSVLVLVLIYVFLGLCIAGDCVLYSLGLKYLAVSTYSLVSASQLAFNAAFAVFINAQKLTFLVLNSLVLLTISSVVVIIPNDAEDKASKHEFLIGIICTVAASALYAFMLSFTELMFQKVLKGKTVRLILDLTIYQSLFATFAILIGLFASGEWKSLKTEMDEFKLGKASYVLTLLWTAVSWQIFNIGCNGLIFKVSSLFSNVISVVGLPITPVLAVMIFHDKVTGAKVVSLLLALRGFLSCVYQHYLDDLKTKAERNLPTELKSIKRAKKALPGPMSGSQPFPILISHHSSPSAISK